MPQNEPKPKANVFVNTAGEEYQLLGLSPFINTRLMNAAKDEYKLEHGSLPEVPKYSITTAAGDVEVHEHDPTTLVVEGDPEQTKANQAAWAEFVMAQAEVLRLYNTKVMRAIVMAVKAEPTQAWRDEMKFIGYALPPEGSPEERFHFVETQVIRSSADLSSLVVKMFQMAGVIQEDAVAEVEATFRHYVERAYVEAARKEKPQVSLASE